MAVLGDATWRAGMAMTEIENMPPVAHGLAECSRVALDRSKTESYRPERIAVLVIPIAWATRIEAAVLAMIFGDADRFAAWWPRYP